MRIVQDIHTQRTRGALPRPRGRGPARRRRRCGGDFRAAVVYVVGDGNKRHLLIAESGIAADGVRRHEFLRGRRRRRGCLRCRPRGTAARGDSSCRSRARTPSRRTRCIAGARGPRGAAAEASEGRVGASSAAASLRAARLDAAAGRRAGVAGAPDRRRTAQHRAVQIEVVIQTISVHRCAARRALDEA